MPYTVSWYNNRRVVHAQLQDNINLEDLQHLNAGIMQYIYAVSGPVQVLIDAREIQTFPIGIRKIRETLSFLRDPKLDWLVVVGGSGMLELLAYVVTQMSEKRCKMFNVLESATTFFDEIEAEVYEV